MTQPYALTLEKQTSPHRYPLAGLSWFASCCDIFLSAKPLLPLLLACYCTWEGIAVGICLLLELGACILPPEAVVRHGCCCFEGAAVDFCTAVWSSTLQTASSAKQCGFSRRPASFAKHSTSNLMLHRPPRRTSLQLWKKGGPGSVKFSGSWGCPVQPLLFLCW